MEQKEFEKNLKKIVSACKKIKSLGIFYLFGSRARQDASPKSDFDFAAYILEKNPVKRFKCRTQIMQIVSEILGTDNIDVVDLVGSKNPTLKFNIVKDGIVLYELQPYKVQFEPRVLSEYFDFEACLKKGGLQ